MDKVVNRNAPRPYSALVHGIAPALIDPFAIEFELSVAREEAGHDFSDHVQNLQVFHKSILEALATSSLDHISQCIEKRVCAFPKTCLITRSCRQPLACGLDARYYEIGNFLQATDELSLAMRGFAQGCTTVSQLELQWWRWAAYVGSPAITGRLADLSETLSINARLPRKKERKRMLKFDWDENDQLHPTEELREHVIDQSLILALKYHHEREEGCTRGWKLWVMELLDLSRDKLDHYLK